MKSLPGDTFTMNFPDIPSGSDVGFQIRRASTDTVVSARTTMGVANTPVGLDNYVVTGLAPVEEGTYLVIADWNSGILDPATSKIQELEVTSSAVEVDPSGLGPVADAAKAHFAQTFSRLAADTDYGETFIRGRVEVVKRRVMTSPPATAEEDTLDPLVIDYLGKLVVLELMPAAVDYWAVQYQSESTGQDPTETASYPDRLKALSDLEELLLRQVRRDEVTVLPLIEGNQRLRSASDGPSIDELDDCRVTPDPRNHPSLPGYSSNGRDRTGVVIG